jgi:hypothetical protein
MKVHADYIPVTSSTVLSNITIQFERKDLQFRQKEGISAASIHLYGRVTSMTRRPITYFEEDLEVQVPSEMLQAAQGGGLSDIYQKGIPLKPGRYRLSIAAKDQVGGNQTTYEMPLDVPHMEDDQVTTSSLILADTIENVAKENIGNGPFVIGTTKVRPRIDNIFKRSEKLGIYMQLYNFDVDETTHKPEGSVEYEVINNATKEKIVEPYSEDVSKLPGGASELIIKRLLPLSSFQPGSYTVNIKIYDKRRNQTVTRSAIFTVT